MNSMGHFHLITCGTFSFNYDTLHKTTKKADGLHEDHCRSALIELIQIYFEIDKNLVFFSAKNAVCLHDKPHFLFDYK